MEKNRTFLEVKNNLSKSLKAVLYSMAVFEFQDN